MPVSFNFCNLEIFVTATFLVSMTLTLNIPWYNYLSVLAVLDEDEQTLINVNIVDKEKVRFISKIVNISLKFYSRFVPAIRPHKGWKQ